MPHEVSLRGVLSIASRRAGTVTKSVTGQFLWMKEDPLRICVSDESPFRNREPEIDAALHPMMLLPFSLALEVCFQSAVQSNWAKVGVSFQGMPRIVKRVRLFSGSSSILRHVLYRIGQPQPNACQQSDPNQDRR